MVAGVEERRNRADLIELFKMVRGLSSVPLQTYFQLAVIEDTLVATDGNWLKLTVHAVQDFTSSMSVC